MLIMLARLANRVSVFSDVARQHMAPIDLQIAIGRQDAACKKTVGQCKTYGKKHSINPCNKIEGTFVCWALAIKRNCAETCRRLITSHVNASTHEGKKIVAIGYFHHPFSQIYNMVGNFNSTVELHYMPRKLQSLLFCQIIVLENRY